MGEHAGIFFLEGRPAGSECASLVAGLQPISHDAAASTYVDDRIAMACVACDPWQGVRSSLQPVRSASGLVVVWDGRLDNRQDLLLRLGPLVAGDASDEAIAVAAFGRWGLDGLRALIGDWCLAIWDCATRTLHLARDYIGVRPLYYCLDSRAVLWSTNLREISERSGRCDLLSDAFVSRFMSLRFSGEVTPFEGIRGVPAATCVSIASSGNEQRHRFWRFEPGLIRYRNRRQYEEQLRALWREAVGARLRTAGTVWAELSGGFDSSSVVCMADGLIKSGGVGARAVQPISYVTLRSAEGDERRFIAEVEARLGVTSEILGVEDYQQLRDAELDMVTPFATCGVALAGARRIRERGGRIVLSGRLGDAVMGCEPDNSIAIFDDLSEAHFLRALSNLRRWSRCARKPFIEIAWTLSRRCTLSGFTRSIERRALARAARGLALLTPRLQRIVEDEASSLSCALESVRPSKRQIAAQVLGDAFGAQLNIPHPPAGLVYTHPFTHRPLVEYVAAIPGEELSAPGELRSLMRRSFEGLVPARILRRVSKGYYPPSAMRATQPLAAAMRPVERLEVVQRGWIDPAHLDAAIQILTVGGTGSGGEVRRVLRLEEWLACRTTGMKKIGGGARRDSTPEGGENQ